MAKQKIRVLIVDDSLFFREFIASALSGDPAIEVVGQAGDPYQARDEILLQKPDVMTLDIEMPRMDGIEFLKKLMPQYPLPVLVLSSANHRVFDAMEAGAVDFVNKANLSNKSSMQTFMSELIIKIKIASIAKLDHTATAPAYQSADGLKSSAHDGYGDIIAIGASTGGTEAVHSIFCKLSDDLPGIVVVQHMPPVFTSLYAQRLNKACKMEVKEAENGDRILPGCAYIAPGGMHMQVVKAGREYKIKCFADEKVNGHCPSVGVLFESVAKTAGAHSLGIILTGMGSDGAKGLLSMRKRGAATLGQNQKSCVVYGMPMVAKQLGAVQTECPLSAMPLKIYRWRQGH